MQVACTAGAQTTADTVVLAGHAASRGRRRGRDRAAVLSAGRGRARRSHAAAAAAGDDAVLPVRVPRASGRYTISPAVIERLRELAPNLAGLKVSNTPFDAVEPFLARAWTSSSGRGAPRGRAGHGAAGAVSGLAASFPERVVEPCVRDPDRPSRPCRRAEARARARSVSRGVQARRRPPRRGAARGRARAAPRAHRRRADRAWTRGSNRRSRRGRRRCLGRLPPRGARGARRRALRPSGRWLPERPRRRWGACASSSRPPPRCAWCRRASASSSASGRRSSTRSDTSSWRRATPGGRN